MLANIFLWGIPPLPKGILNATALSVTPIMEDFFEDAFHLKKKQQQQKIMLK